MVKLTKEDGKVMLLQQDAIASILEAGPSSQWHGVKSHIRTWKGQYFGVRETVYEIEQLIREESITNG